MVSLPKPLSSRERAAALIIVLAFVVLLSGLMLAYLSRTTTDRQVSHGSFNQSKADQLAASAMDNIIGGLRQEIINGSTATAIGGTTIYSPTNNAYIAPMCSPTPTPGETPAIPNLIRRSARSEPDKWPDSFVGPALGSHASAVNSTADVSANGRSVSLRRWNSHYLVPKSNTGDDTSDPITTGFAGPNYWAPDWIFVTGQGATVITSPSNSVIGRYAYAIYDEGGLLDLNVAGYPTGTSIYQYGRKGSLAFADLTALGSYPIPNPNSGSPPIYQVDRLVGWRNYGTTQPTNNFPDSTPAQAFAKNFQTSATPATNYFNAVVSNTNGFLQVRSNASPSPSPWPYASPSPYPAANERTDQMFLSRQQLIAFRNTTQFSVNALQYLTHFSREAEANAPQWSPPTPTAINPNFQTLRVTGSFIRNDGSTANVGDYLVNKRFLLQRLNWLTYKGPSALRTIPTSAPAVGSVNYDMWLLVSRFGLTTEFLQQGTAANILTYFGLAWDTTNERWNYVGHNGSATPISSLSLLGSLTGTREPDCFELLQAGTLDSSLGISSASDPALPIAHQQSKMLQILTIGANLIAQARTDTYPVRIACTVNVSGTNTTMEAIGRPRLPYLNSLAACPVAGTGKTGGINWLLVPNVWDPFRDTWDRTELTVNSTLTPGYLRPPVRIRVSGSVGFGTVTSGSFQTGSVPSGSVATLGAPISVNSNLTFTTGATTGNAFGRDGHGEASRLSTSDFSAAPAAYTTTTSPASPSSSWNSVSRPPRPDGTFQGTTNVVVYRLSLPGSSIPSTTTTTPQNPVLILYPGFQMTMEYQSSNGTWYPYSFLQGNNATKTWIGASTASNPPLTITTTISQYGYNPAPTPAPPATDPTILESGVATPWDMVTLAQAPMFAKADPRSIRYNSEIGVVNLTAPPMSVVSAGVIGSLSPNPYATPPPMTPGPNPANYAQSGGDYGASASNPYNETNGDAIRPIVMNRPFRSVGEMGYAFRDQPFKTLDFSSASSPDAGLLDLFSVDQYNDASGARAGVINLNSRQAPAIAALLTSTIRREDTPRVTAGSSPSPAPSPLGATDGNNAATSLVSLTTTTPVTNKAGLAALIASELGLGPTTPKTQREAIARALGEADQTRTWNLMIDVIAQSGRYPPVATDLTKFVVEGEQRYWVHVAIDRFTGQVIDKQIEIVKE